MIHTFVFFRTSLALLLSDSLGYQERNIELLISLMLRNKSGLKETLEGAP